MTIAQFISSMLDRQLGGFQVLAVRNNFFFFIYDPIDQVSTSNSQGVMKWSKRPKSLTEKAEFSPHALPISDQFPKETLVASWHWQISINPRQVFAISLIRSPGTTEQGSSLASCRAFHSFTQAHHRVSKVQQKTCSLGEQRTRAPSIFTLS